MPIVAYIANQFPSPVEPYVAEEIQELRGRGVQVIPCSARRAEGELDSNLRRLAGETLYFQPIQLGLVLRAVYLCLKNAPLLSDLVVRVLFRGKERPSLRLRALLHTWLGAYYALRLQGRGIEHIHAHHGYFAAWVAMVAARFLGAGFSMTLHGSDVLLHAAYLDTKLANCTFCVTVSEFNRCHILEHYAQVAPEKIIVRRMGVLPVSAVAESREQERESRHIVMLAAGRLHRVKDHAFLVRACHKLKGRGLSFLCLIAGEGEERFRLERLIRKFDLRAEVKLLGHLGRKQLDACYAACELVVLTSQSEGIPLVLMEAMSYGRFVLAPAITGIPELVRDGETGFLYRAGSLDDFVAGVEKILHMQPALAGLSRAARQHVLEHFNREKNLAAFADLFLARMAAPRELNFCENTLLQQI